MNAKYTAKYAITDHAGTHEMQFANCTGNDDAQAQLHGYLWAQGYEPSDVVCTLVSLEPTHGMQDFQVEALLRTVQGSNPRNKVELLVLDCGKAIKVSGKGAKLVAWYWNRENYLEGYTDTPWDKVYPRHGLGYLIPCYNNPLNVVL